MKIRNKITTLFILVFCILAASLFFIIRTERSKTKLLIESHESTQKNSIENLLKFKSELLNKIVFDYTYWDDMVNFVKTGDTVWAKYNLNTLYISYQITSSCVYNNEKELIYHCCNIPELDSSKGLIPNSAFDLLNKNKFYSFFINTKAGLIEISGATIHPTKDIDRKTKSQGYFYCARLWDNKYISDLANISGCKVSVYPFDKEIPKSNQSLIITSHTIYDSNQLPLINLVCEKSLTYVSHFRDLTFNTFAFFSLITLLLIITFGVSFNYLVNKPITIITRFLDSQDLNVISKLKNKRNEFGRISKLLIESFNHKIEIENEVKERRAIQNSLLESQKRLQTIINNAPNVAIEGYDINGKVLFWNEAATKIFGFTEQEVIGKSIDQSILDVQATKEFIETLKQIDKTNIATEPTEWVVKTKDKKAKTVLSTIFPVYSDITDEKFFVCMDVDMSDRKELQIELQLKNEEIIAQNEELTVANEELTELYSTVRNSEEIFRSVIMQANDGIVLLDPECKIIQWNKATEKITGFTAEETIGKYSWDVEIELLPLEKRTPKTKAKIETIVQQIAETRKVSEKTQHIEGFILSKKDKKTKYIQLSSFIINTEKSFLIGRVVHDLTNILEAKKTLEKNEKKYRELTELLPIVVFETDLQANFTYLNKKAHDLFGYASTDIEKGLSIFDVVPKNRHEEVMLRIGDIIQNEKDDITLESIIYTKGGKEILCNIYPKIYKDNNNQPIGVRGVVVDISLQKQTEELHNQLEISKKTTEIKQQFLANMSHEIRTPMMGIIGMIDLLYKTEISGQQQDYLETIKDSSETLLNIINDILELSKIESGKTEIKPVPFNIHNITYKIKTLFAALAKHKNIRYNTSYTNDLPDYIYADENKITQIITNLVANAVKFTQQGSVTAKFSLLSNIDNILQVKIEVIDTGIGINAKDQEMIFSTFTQVESANTRNFEGTGLGLSICKKLANMLGGEIGVISESGKGSTFWFTFIAENVNEDQIMKTVNKQEKSDIQKLNLSILLVEDKFVNQKVIELMLKDAGCKVDIASNGEIALEKYEPNKYDLILMDIQMPVMDGITTLNILKKKYKHLEPIIALSANVMEGDEEHYLAEGMNDYIGKPVSQKNLVEIIAKWTINLKK